MLNEGKTPCMASPNFSSHVFEEEIKHPHWLAELADTVPIGIVVIDASGCITWCNNELQQQFRYSSAELVGQSIELLLPERFRKDHAALRTGYAAAPTMRSMGNGRELFGRRQDGFEFPVEIGLRSLQTAFGPMFVATVVDISARRQAEAMFRRVIEAAPCGMMMVDQNQRITLVNNHLLQLFGYEHDELINQQLDRLIPQRHHEKHAEYIANYRHNATMRVMGPNMDLTAMRKDGSEFSVEIGLNPVQMESGQFVLATVVDVTVRKLTEQRLKRANADLEEFNYIAAHDLRSPLRGIADLVSWIVEDLGEQLPAGVAEHVERMRTRVARMDALIESLLKYARAGVAATEAEFVDVKRWLEEEIELLNPPADFKFEVRTEIPQIAILKTPISTVLRNLISNAIKYNDKANGQVTVEVRQAGAELLFVVADNGPGIPKVSRERVFKLFQRLSSSKDGTGIGLSIVKRIVESHGGSVSVDDRSDGQPGAAFRVQWPLNIRGEA